MDEFRKELAALINKHSKENGSNTPDWILAEYLSDCLAAFDRAIQHRKDWYTSEGRLEGQPRNVSRMTITFTGKAPPCPKCGSKNTERLPVSFYHWACLDCEHRWV